MSQYKELAWALDTHGEDDKQRDQIAAILRSLDAQKPVGYWGGAFSSDGGADLYEVEQVSAFGRVYKNVPLYAAPVAAQPTKHYRTLRGNWTNTTTHVCNFCGFETRSEHSIVAHQCDGRKAAQPQAKPLSDAWAEGYKAGIEDERISESNIGIAGYSAKVTPARQNPYGIKEQG